MLLTSRCRRALNEKAVICFYCRLYLLLSHILGVSLPPSACSNPLCRHPPPSSEGGEGAPAPCTELQKCKPRLSPPTAGCPHPSRRGTVPHRATFPKGKAKRSRAVRRVYKGVSRGWLNEKCAQFALQRTGSREMRFIWLITPILRIIIHNALFSDLSLWDAHILRKGSERVAKILQKLGL